MIIGLKQAMADFCRNIKESNPDYISIYSFFCEYINSYAYLEENISLEYFFKNEFSRLDIINSCAYYFRKSNATKETAITKYLNAMTKFYNSYIAPNGYDNKNLFAILPFSQLFAEVKQRLGDKKPQKKEVCPAITQKEFKQICEFYNNKEELSIVQKEFNIIFKLIMLYGFKLERIKYLGKKDFDPMLRQLKLRLDNNRSITLEIPYSLSKDISDYLHDSRCNSTGYMFLNKANQIITPSFLYNGFIPIRKSFGINAKTNEFTSTGLAKFAITNMLQAGIDVPVIKIITGMEDDIIDDCSKAVYKLNEEIKLNRYINSRVRSIETYDCL